MNYVDNEIISCQLDYYTVPKLTLQAIFVWKELQLTFIYSINLHLLVKKRNFIIINMNGTAIKIT